MFYKSILEKFGFTITFSCLALAMLLSYGNVGVILGPNATDSVMDPLNVIGGLLNIAFIFLILLSKYIVKRQEDIKQFGETKVENPDLIYFICLPLTVAIIICEVITFLMEMYNERNPNLFSLFFTTTVILYFVGLLLILIQMNGFYDFGEKWEITSSNIFAIMIAINGQIYFISLFSSLEQATIFTKNVNISEIKQKCQNLTNGEMQSIFCGLWNISQSFLSKFQLALGLICMLLLVKAYKKLYKNLQRYKKEERFVSQTIGNNMKIFDKIVMILVSGTVNILFLVALIWERDHSVRRWTCLGEIFVLIIMSYFTVKQLLVITKLPDQNDLENKNIFNEIILWTGLLGQFMQSFAVVAYVCFGHTDSKFWSQVLTVSRSLMQYVQNTIQTIYGCILVEKKLPKINFSIIAPVSFLAIANFQLGIINIWLFYRMKEDMDIGIRSTNDFPYYFMTLLAFRIGTIFTIMQKFYSSFLLFRFNFIVYKDNKKGYEEIDN